MDQVTSLSALTPILPELALGIGAMVLLMIGVVRRGGGGGAGVNALSTVLLLGVAVLLCAAPAERHELFGGSFVIDDFARFLKLLAVLAAAGTMLLSLDFLEAERQQKFEYGPLVVLSTLGMCVLISAADLIALYLGLELMSLALYVIAASDRDNVRSTEAGLKYFVLGALSSGMLLYGASLVYGFTGTISFAGIAKAAGGGGLGLIFGLVFLFVGFCFKISAVPFHMWTPDVYEGAPTPVTTFFASAVKAAAIAMFVRATIVAFPSITHEWQQIVVFVSIASMALGSFAAIGQKNIKRLMA
jgi:NADH-quinone oxidoreductase subunit N